MRRPQTPSPGVASFTSYDKLLNFCPSSESIAGFVPLLRLGFTSVANVTVLPSALSQATSSKPLSVPKRVALNDTLVGVNVKPNFGWMVN